MLSRLPTPEAMAARQQGQVHEPVLVIAPRPPHPSCTTQGTPQIVGRAWGFEREQGACLGMGTRVQDHWEIYYTRVHMCDCV